MGLQARLRTGLTATLRAALARHLRGLDPLSRLNRFFAPAPDGMIDAYIREAAPLFVVTAEEDGRICGVAEVHLHRDPARGAEIAVSVDEDRRRAGLGSALFARAVEECRARGVADVSIVYLRGNVAMRRIAERAGFARVPGGDAATVTARLGGAMPAERAKMDGT